MPAIISRAKAKSLGLKRYFTGKPQKCVGSLRCAEVAALLDTLWSAHFLAVCYSSLSRGFFYRCPRW